MPGPFLTDISKAWDIGRSSSARGHDRARRGGEPEEVVGAALYFASDASSFSTGAVLGLDGAR